MLAAAAVLMVGYVLGMFPTADLVGRHVGADPRAAGSGNPGATNVTRVAGWRAGAVVFAGDALKGAAAAGLGLVAGAAVDGGAGSSQDGSLLAWLAGAAAVVGHVFPLLPPTRCFRGGKGVATWLGALVVAAPVAAACAVAVWGVVAAITRRASAASVVTVLVVPPLVGLTGGDLAAVVVAAGIAILIVVTHRSNLVRLAAGTEDHVRL
jgi:glycerol-3-phosphate acyltransferase PlsY